MASEGVRDVLLGPVPAEFRTSLERWDDQRYLSRAQLWSLWVFTQYLTNLADEDGWVYDGHSWKASAPLGTLTVRATLSEVPVVCFTSARTFLNAVGIFVRKLSEFRVEWVRDRYRS